MTLFGRAIVEIAANQLVLLNVLYSAEPAPIMIFRVRGGPSFTSPKLILADFSHVKGDETVRDDKQINCLSRWFSNISTFFYGEREHQVQTT